MVLRANSNSGLLPTKVELMDLHVPLQLVASSSIVFCKLEGEAQLEKLTSMVPIKLELVGTNVSLTKDFEVVEIVDAPILLLGSESHPKLKTRDATLCFTDADVLDAGRSKNTASPQVHTEPHRSPISFWHLDFWVGETFTHLTEWDRWWIIRF